MIKKVLIILLVLIINIINIGYAAVLRYKDGKELNINSIIDQNGNDVIRGFSKNGSVLIPLYEVSKIIHIEGRNILVVYKDNTQDTITLNEEVSLIAKLENGGSKPIDLNSLDLIDFNKNITIENTSQTNSSNLNTNTINQKPQFFQNISQDSNNIITTDNSSSIKSANNTSSENIVLDNTNQPPVYDTTTNFKTESTEDSLAIQQSNYFSQKTIRETTQEKDLAYQQSLIENTQQDNTQTKYSSEDYLEYEIKRFDTLWDIAGRFYGNPFLWSHIWKSNPYIDNPDLIYPGDYLKIPKDYLIKNNVKVTENGALAPSDYSLTSSISGQATNNLMDRNDLSMFVTENSLLSSTASEQVSSSMPLEQDEIYELINGKNFKEFFSYSFHSQLGFFVDRVQLNTKARLIARYTKNYSFVPYYSEVRITLGSNDGVKEGDKFYVVEFEDLGVDYKTKERLPYYARIKGEVKVIKVFKNYSVGYLTRCYEKVYNNDVVLKKTPPSVPKIKKVLFDKKLLESYIVKDLTKKSKVSYPLNLYLIKGGSMEGFEVGQVFDIYTMEKDREYSDLPVGEILIVKTFAHYSVALLGVRWSRVYLKKGDLLRYKFKYELTYSNK